MWSTAFWLVATLSGATGIGENAASKPTLVMMPLQVSALPEGTGAILDELLAAALRSLDQHQVLGKSDVEVMLGGGGIDNPLACDEVACAAEIGGAMGAAFLVAGRVAKLGDNIIIVLKLIDAQKRRVTNSIKYKSADQESTYDAALSEAVQRLFGVSKPSPPRLDKAAGDPLRLRISDADWHRYQYRTEVRGDPLTLSDWIAEKNHESTLLFLGELATGVVWALAVPLVILGHKKHPDDVKPAILLASSTVALGGLITIDLLNIGAVDVAPAPSPQQPEPR